MEGDSAIRLVVGLGNPGREYLDTRHNVGFMIVERLVAAGSETWSTERRWDCRVARAGATWFIKPQTYMNLSGRAVARVAAFHRIPPEEILVVHDDVSLPLGRIRFRASGSAGGHNGIKSIIAELGTDSFARLKVGIDGNRPREDLSGYVLGKFSPGEAEILEKTLQESCGAVECALDSGVASAMNRFNRDPEPARPVSPRKTGPPEQPGTGAAPTPESPT